MVLSERPRSARESAQLFDDRVQAIEDGSLVDGVESFSASAFRAARAARALATAATDDVTTTRRTVPAAAAAASTRRVPSTAGAISSLSCSGVLAGNGEVQAAECKNGVQGRQACASLFFQLVSRHQFIDQRNVGLPLPDFLQCIG